MQNELYYGDNLEIIRKSIKDESVDLIYLDPPFNSNADYNVLFRSPDGKNSHAQVEAFKDTWHWGHEAENAFDDVLKSGFSNCAEMLRMFRSFLRENDMMAYLVMMTVRLIELHRVLKPTGSLYLHCDNTASHYLKIVLDTIFGAGQFRNEIVWKRSTAHSNSKRFGRNTDSIFYYTKGKKWTWNPIHTEYSEEWIARFNQIDEDGRRWRDGDLTAKGLTGSAGYTYEYKGVTSLWRCPLSTMQRLDEECRLHFTSKGGIRIKRYLDEMKGYNVQSLWDDIPPLNSQSKERLGYPTQKPLALLDRIIKASSNEGDLVLDPFCGCGTTVHAAEKLNRGWIGIDITVLSISKIERRLRNSFDAIKYQLYGTPKDMDGAYALALKDKYQFQWWAVSLIRGATPWENKKKGADGGIDGLLFFKTGKKTTEKAIISVKGGKNIDVKMIRELINIVDKEHAKMGLFITLFEPTSVMRRDAIAAGYYEYEGMKYPKIQILSINDLFNGIKPQTPLIDESMFRISERERSKINQGDLGF
jgi:DNA modification methylase